MEIGNKEVQIAYAVCYDPHNTFNPSEFIIEKEFAIYKEAKDWMCGYGYKIYVKASILDHFGFTHTYWGRSLQHAISKLKKKEKL